LAALSHILILLVEQQLSKQISTSPRPLGLLIGAVRRSIKQAVTRRLRRRRLSAQQFWLLVALHEQPGPSLRELAEGRLMDSPTASRIVTLLLRRGLVRLEADPRDRRRRSIRLTARGTALARELHPLALQVREAIGAGFSEAEAEKLRGMLLRMISNVERFDGRGSSGTRPPAGRRRRR
jgi:DNA-binding MarR family transcriptional regulator